MQIFVKTLTGSTLTMQVEESCLVSDLKEKIQQQEGIASEEMVLIHGLQSLEDELALFTYGIQDDATISLTMRLLGGKKKRKKKIYTKPKKIKHKHRKRSKALLEYFDVDNTGKITKLKIECEKCPAGTYMADHPDRHTCGRCGNMFYKLTKDGKRMPIPKQNKPGAAAAADGKPDAKKAPAKKKK